MKTPTGLPPPTSSTWLWDLPGVSCLSWGMLLVVFLPNCLGWFQINDINLHRMKIHVIKLTKMKSFKIMTIQFLTKDYRELGNVGSRRSGLTLI